MKKIYALLAFAILLMACNDAVQMPAPGSTPNSSKRTKAQAIELAQAIMDCQPMNSRTDGVRTVADVDGIVRAGSRSGADTLIYVVNFADDNGFVLVSAATAGEPIIGFSDKGNYNTADALPTDAPFSFYLDAACDYVASATGIGDEPIPDPYAPVETRNYLIPRVMVEWGTGYPESMYTTVSYTATAMAQMMSFLKYPTSIELTYAKRDIDVQPLDWAEMCRHHVSIDKGTVLSPTPVDEHLSYCFANLEAHQAIGRLCSELNYRTKETAGVMRSTLPKARTTFIDLFAEDKVSEIVEYADDAALYAVLENPNAVIMMQGTGWYYPTSSSMFPMMNMHQWVCCGAIQVRLTYSRPDIDGNMITTYNDTYYFYFNWGEKGEYNGYFLAGVFNPSTPYTPNTGSRSLSIADYNSDVKYFSVEKM